MPTSISDNLPQQRFKAEQVRDNEASVAKTQGIEMYQLMLDAGRAVFELVSTYYGCKNLLVLCGYGNNGGDGYVVAKLALIDNWKVSVVQVGNTDKLKGDAKRAYDDFVDAGGKVDVCLHGHIIHDELVDDELVADQNTVVVDALLGTGVTGDVREPMAGLIDWVNHQAVAGEFAGVVSVDVPSGLDSNTGVVANTAIRATQTCTFIGVKQGLSTGLGPDYCGKLYYADLAIGEAFNAQVQASAWCVNQKQLAEVLPKRQLASHKGSFGHVLLIGSDKGMSGAIRMAGRACFRTGAGLVSIVTHNDNEMVVAADSPEFMVSGVNTDTDIRPWLDKVDVIALGPGLGQNSWGQSMFTQVIEYLKHTPKPCVLDADALNIMASLKFYPRFDIGCFEGKSTVITPHPLEAARLLRSNTKIIQQDRFEAAKTLSDITGAVALLKGVGTVICSVDEAQGCMHINTSGNPGMATAGMGDVLTGIIGALMAQRFSAKDAAIFGAFIHGLAADSAAKQGERGMMATDILAYIRQVVNTSDKTV